MLKLALNSSDLSFLQIKGFNIEEVFEIPALEVERKVCILHLCHAEFISASMIAKYLWILKQVQND